MTEHPSVNQRESVISLLRDTAGMGSMRGVVAARRVLVMACAGLIMGAEVWAQTPQLPDALQPGGARPDTTTRMPPAPAPGGLLEIPPLVERSLSPGEGPRIRVSRFELLDARDLPRFGIRADEARALLSQALQEQQADGFTIGEMEAVANRVTNYYRQRGLILAKTVLPVQTVNEGVVTLQVIEGRLGQVLAEGNSMYSTPTLARPFGDLLGEPVSQQDAESALLTLTDYPGLAVFGTFQPGKRVGEADLLLRVPNEERFTGSLRVDNQGSETTGLYRGRAQLNWNNPTDHADRLSLTLQQSVQPANNFYGALDYQLILDRFWQAGGFARSNRFTVGGEFADIDIGGVSNQYGLFLKQVWWRSREGNFSTQQELASKYSATTQFGDPANEDRLTVLKLSLNYDSVDTRYSGLNYAGLEFSQGFNDLLGAMGDSDSANALDSGRRPSRRSGKDTNVYAEGAFSKVLAFYSRLQNITSRSSLLFRTEFQYSNDLLVPMEQYAVGGADNLRGYDGSHTLYDTGGLLSLEYILQAPGLGDAQAPFGGLGNGWRWRDLFQVSVFYDHALGRKNQPLSNGNEPVGNYQLSSVGVGARFNIPNKLNSRIQLAFPLTDESGNEEDAAAKSEPKLWFDLAWLF
jgi:hemolysin activation/secretion protein